MASPVKALTTIRSLGAANIAEGAKIPPQTARPSASPKACPSASGDFRCCRAAVIVLSDLLAIRGKRFRRHITATGVSNRLNGAGTSLSNGASDARYLAPCGPHFVPHRLWRRPCRRPEPAPAAAQGHL